MMNGKQSNQKEEMMRRMVLYFSVWKEHREKFAEKAKEFENKLDFQVVSEGDFFHASDLLTFLGQKKQHDLLSRLYVIVDYLPFFSDLYNTKDNNYEIEADSISKAIMGYPEVYFLFDDTLLVKEKLDFLLFLPLTNGSTKLAKNYHCINMNDENWYYALANHRTNLFDGTNLRYCLKVALYESLIVERHNFSRIQTSRSQNLVACVEEERTQNRFNSYALYANGFRVWPIMSALELKDFNEQWKTDSSDLRLIVRDYDLQFSDADSEKDNLKIDKKEGKINLVDYIRGVKCIENEEGDPVSWKPLENEINNHFWNGLVNIPRFFISKGRNKLEIITNEEKYRKVRPDDTDSKSLFNDESVQKLHGMHKPVTGIYCSFHNSEIIKQRYEQGVQWGKEPNAKRIKRKRGKIKNRINRIKRKKKIDRLSAKIEKLNADLEYFIQTNRKEHQHGVPLDIYDLTKEMIDRADFYQHRGKFVFSAMVAQEAIEILNGFHESLMLKAYYIFAVSENAICMNLLGGDERWLEKDAIFRVDKIQRDLKRMLARQDGDVDRSNLHLNILNQMFSECRQFCKRHEHFSSEAVFIDAMSHLNEGYNIIDLFDEIKELGRRIRNEWLSFNDMLGRMGRILNNKIKQNKTK